MAQQSNKHLTIAELSAYIDKELASEELALCDAHLETCQPCRAALADLHLTSALLNSMPQVEVPRSFVLPTNMVVLPVTPAPRPAVERRPTLASPIWRRSLRAVSTLVAVLGLFFLLAGAFAALPRSGAAMTATGSAGLSQSRAASQARSGPTPLSSAGMASATVASATQSNVVPTSTPTVADSHSPNPTPLPPAQSPELPAVLDLSRAAGRLAIGATLVLLGMLGVLATYLFNRSTGR